MAGWLITGIYFVRFLSGFLFHLGYRSLFIAALLLAVLQCMATLTIRRAAKKHESLKKKEPVLDLIFWIILSAYFGLDALTSGTSWFSPWALLIIAPIVLNPCDPGYYTLFSATLPAALGIAEAAGAFSGGSPRYGIFLSILLAFILGSIARLRGIKRKAELDQALAYQQDRERKIMQLQDAEVEIAARIQRTLLVDQAESGPQNLALDAITVASNAVDGDFYGFIPYGSSEIDVLVGDVMGKGVPAALVGAALKGAFLRQSLRLIVENQGRLPTPSELVTAVHGSIVDQLMDLDRFATLQYIRFNTRTLTMTYVDCGHTPFIHYDASLGICWIIRGTNLPIGFTDEQTYHAYQIPLSIGDRFLFYSDGISEARNEKKELFGEARLAEILRMNAMLPPRELLRRILNTVMFFASAEGFKDDVTCIAVAIEPMEVSMTKKSRDFSCEMQSLAGVRSFINLALPETLAETRKASITEAVIEAAEVILRHIGSTQTRPDSGDKETGKTAGGAAPDKREEGPIGSPDEAVEELEELSAEEPFTTLMAYRVECRITDSWISIRIIYHGTALPQKRGRELVICKQNKPDSVYVAQGQDNLAMAGLVFFC